MFAAVSRSEPLRVSPAHPSPRSRPLVAVGAAALLVQRRRPLLLYAAVATAGIAVLGHGPSSNIGWFAVCLIGALVRADRQPPRGPGLLGRRADPVRGRMAVGQADPGWGAWMAGITLTVAWSAC